MNFFLQSVHVMSEPAPAGGAPPLIILGKLKVNFLHMVSSSLVPAPPQISVRDWIVSPLNGVVCPNFGQSALTASF